MVADCAAARVRHREGDPFLEDVVPGLLGCVRKVEDDAKFAEPADERSAPVGQSLRRCVDPSGELVRVVPGQTRRTHTTLVPLFKRAGIALERLDALHRQHEPQAWVSELGARVDLADLLGVLLDDAPELRLLGECALTRVATACAFAVQGADLDADVACCEPRQPVALEDARLSETQDELEGRLVAVADEQLEQHVGVRVDDHGRPVDGHGETETTLARRGHSQRDERWSSEPKT
jgi:hypothetical protein